MDMRARERVDVIIVGGGIAGLGAARELARAGWRVILFEARGRLGGRIFPLETGASRASAELGAEFVHGNNRELRALARRAGARMEAVSRDMFELRDGELREARDYWKSTTEILKSIPRRTRASLAKFLAEKRTAFSPEDLRRVRDHVQSFNAGPAARISAAVLSTDHAGADTPQYRLRGGYGKLVAQLEKELDELGVVVQRETEVRKVRWTRSRVEVVARFRRHEETRHGASAVVVTLPLGVLKSRAIRFEPRLKEKEAVIRRLGWGDVSRILLRFDAAFLERLRVTTAARAKRPRDFSFIHAPGLPFPVWWSADGWMTGWAGGPLAKPLLPLTPAGLKKAAICSLSGIWGVSQATVRSGLRGAWSHSWAGDPYSRGAYSYAVAGFEDGPARLAKPVGRTIFFAGEAAAEELGTVHGALASGVKAAREIAWTLAAKRPAGKFE